MIEDALKSTRALHRLILAVSLVTLVFSLSLRILEEEREQKATVDELIQVDFLAYEHWLKPKIDAAIKKHLGPVAATIKEALAEKHYLTFGLDDIYATFEAPPHVGKLLTEDLILSNVSSSTLSALDGLNGLSLARDIQITVPDTDPLVSELLSFLDEHAVAGKRISNAYITIVPFDFNAESFLPGETVLGTLYFELVDAVAVAAAPIFQGSFSARIVDVPGTSFIQWLTENNIPQVKVQQTQVVFAPSLSGAPNGFRETPLGALSLQLQEKIEKSGPDNRSATILGTEVPGLLLVFAAPLTLMALIYYFWGHTSHIARLADSHPDEMRSFAWLPLSMTGWRLIGTQIRLPGYAVETFLSLCALPLTSLAALYIKLRGFGVVNLSTIILLLSAGLWIGLFAYNAWLNIRQIRATLTKIGQDALRSDRHRRGLDA